MRWLAGRSLAITVGRGRLTTTRRPPGRRGRDETPRAARRERGPGVGQEPRADRRVRTTPRRRGTRPSSRGRACGADGRGRGRSGRVAGRLAGRVRRRDGREGFDPLRSSSSFSTWGTRFRTSSRSSTTYRGSNCGYRCPDVAPRSGSRCPRLLFDVERELLRGLLRHARRVSAGPRRARQAALRDSGATTVLDAGCGPASFLRERGRRGVRALRVRPDTRDGRRGAEGARRVGRAGRADLGGKRRGPRRVPGPGSPEGGYDAAGPASASSRTFRNPPTRSSSRTCATPSSPRGLVVAEARNQLFALFTLNRYTYEFFRDETAPNDDEEVLAPLRERFRMDLPPIRRGHADEPGYDEVLSRTPQPVRAARAVRGRGPRRRADALLPLPRAAADARSRRRGVRGAGGSRRLARGHSWRPRSWSPVAAHDPRRRVARVLDLGAQHVDAGAVSRARPRGG